MSESHTSNQEFDDLAASLCDGRITADELKRLEEVASNNPALLTTLVDLLNVDTQLRQTAKGEASADAIMQAMSEVEAEPIITESVTSPRRHLSMASRHLAVGITIAVAFVVTSLSLMHQILLPVRVATEGKGSDEKIKKDGGPVESIARLVGDVDAKWEGYVENPAFGRKQRIKTGMKLYPGQKLKLASGLAEFKFFNGAEVVLEGPAEFEVLGKKQCRLELGSLAAKAFEERSKGFIVDTPTARVEDLGTVFGVTVNKDAEAEVAVLSGGVEVSTEDSDEVIELTANQALMVAKDGQMHRLLDGTAMIASATKLSSHFNLPMVYVNATAGPNGNTVRTSDSHSSAWTNSPNNALETRRNSDNLWGLPPADQGFRQARLPLVWESAPHEDAPCVTTVISGLSEGHYDVYLLWQTIGGDGPGCWSIQAKLSSAPSFTRFCSEGSVQGTNDHGQKIRRAFLGRVSGTSISVEVDDTPSDRDRSRYVGVAYKAVPADPVTEEKQP